jgi:RND family efflux transporter MFP subunit
LVAILLLAGGAYFAYSRLQPNVGSESASRTGAGWMPEMLQNRTEVRLTSVTVQKGRSADAVVVATGYVESRRQARIGARAVGRINLITFEEGDKVIEGQLLAELDHKDLDASIAASKASVARAKAALEEQMVQVKQSKRQWDRAESLQKSNAMSAAEVDQNRFTYEAAIARVESLKADVTLAEAQLRQAQQIQENMYIRAPFNGTVISKDAEVGESIMPGGMGGNSGRGSVATIADFENLRMECDVQEDFIARIVEGQEADIAIDAVQDKKYHGRVRKIIPMGDRARATIKVQVEFNDADKLLFPEMAGTVYFLPTADVAPPTEDKPRTFCPSTAVVTRDGKHFVWVVDREKRAQRLSIEIGDERDGRTELLSAVEPSTRVIVNPESLTDGAPVKVVD